MAETENIKPTKREAMGERLKAKYPDKEFGDDEAMFGQIGDDYDEYEKKLGGYKEREGKLTELFTKDPRSAKFITDMAKGDDPISGFITLVGIDGMQEMLNDPAKMEEYKEKNQEYVERLAKSKELDEQWEQNIGATLEMLRQKQGEKGLSDEQVDAAADWIAGVIGDGIVGKVSAETFEMALKAINHDSDVAAAGEEGEVRGRNAKAEAMLRKPGKGGEVPVLSGANNGAGGRRAEDSIFKLASEA